MDWTTIIVALIAATPGLWALRHQRRASEAAAVDSLTDTALDIAKDARLETERHKTELEVYQHKTDLKIQSLETELEIQATAINNLQGKNLKLQLVITILVHQLRLQNITPLIEPSEIENLSIEDLRLIVDSTRSAERRLEELKKTREFQRLD